MNYRFDVETGSFFLDDTETGKGWENRIWNDMGYVLNITHIGQSVSQYIDENANRVVLNAFCAGGIYIRDERTGEYFSPTVYPVCRRPDEYLCRHSQLTTEINSRYGSVRTKTEYSVMSDAPCEVWSLNIKNEGETPLELSVFGAIAFDLGGYPMPFYYNPGTTSATEFIGDFHAVFCRNSNPYAPHDRCSGFIACTEKVVAYEGNWEKFTGIAGSTSVPRTIADGRDLSNSLATVRARGGVLQVKFRLLPKEEKVLHFVLGFARDEREVGEYACVGKIKAEAKKRKNRIVFSELRTKAPDERINRIFNFWAEKQVAYCCLGKKAVRDNMQLGMALLDFDAESAKKTFTECLEHQYRDGHAVLLWYPVTDEKLYSDPPMWLILGVCEYVKETGDKGFLEEQIGWLDGQSDSVYNHLKRACEWYLKPENHGRTGLPKIHYADWNDALNIPDENAESVFMAMGVCWAFGEMAALCRFYGDVVYAEKLTAEKNRLKEIINVTAWEEDHYIRAVSKFGKVGSMTDPNGGNLYVNPQSLAILSGVVPPERLPALLRAIDRTETEEGIPLCTPPYRTYSVEVGRMSGMLPGVYENGGIYNHAGCFKVMADCKLKRKDHAANSLLKIIPDGKSNPSWKTTTEPYVFTNCYLKHPAVDMMVGSSWQTGTSAWALRCYYEGILGLKRTYEGLKIDPCLPQEWKETEAYRCFRGASVFIKFINHGGDTVSLTVDGKKFAGQVLPAFERGSRHFVTVELS